MTTIETSSSDAAQLKVDAVVVGLVKKGDAIRMAKGGASVETAYGRNLRKVLASLGATGSVGQVVKMPKSGKVGAPLIVAVGLGDKQGDPETLRRAAGTAVRSLAGNTRVALALPASDVAVGSSSRRGGDVRCVRVLRTTDTRPPPRTRSPSPLWCCAPSSPTIGP